MDIVERLRISGLVLTGRDRKRALAAIEQRDAEIEWLQAEVKRLKDNEITQGEIIAHQQVEIETLQAERAEIARIQAKPNPA